MPPFSPYQLRRRGKEAAAPYRPDASSGMDRTGSHICYGR